MLRTETLKRFFAYDDKGRLYSLEQRQDFKAVSTDQAGPIEVSAGPPYHVTSEGLHVFQAPDGRYWLRKADGKRVELFPTDTAGETKGE